MRFGLVVCFLLLSVTEGEEGFFDLAPQPSDPIPQLSPSQLHLAQAIMDCRSCVAAGFGWSFVRHECGPYVNQACVPPDRALSDISLPNFALFTNCQHCVSIGFGWNTPTSECGLFGNTDCRSGGDDDSSDWEETSLPDFSDFKDCYACTGAGWGWDQETSACGLFTTRECRSESEIPLSERLGVDFSQYKSCESCTAAGWGWSPSLNECGNFETRSCPQEVTEIAYRKGSHSEYTDCESCTKAGWGWCTIKEKCGGFANKFCGKLEDAPKPEDMVEEPVKTYADPRFGDYTDCDACVGAGWGWCHIRRRCGGFSNKECSPQTAEEVPSARPTSPSSSSSSSSRTVVQEEPKQPPPMPFTLESLSDSSFERVVSDSVPALVLLVKDYVPACASAQSLLEDASNRHASKKNIRFGFLNIDMHSEIAAQYNAWEVPTLLVSYGNSQIHKFPVPDSARELKSFVAAVVTKSGGPKHEEL